MTRPGGLVYLSYTVWLAPWGGHESAPFHYLGGNYALRRYIRRHGRKPKNVYGETMFPSGSARSCPWCAGGPTSPWSRRGRGTTRAGAGSSSSCPGCASC